MKLFVISFNFMRRIARTLELSLAANAPAGGGAVERRRNLTNLSNPLERYIGLGVNSLAARHRRTAQVTLNGLSRVIGGVRYLGNGATASVYRDRDSVLKVYRHTIGMDISEQKRFIERRQAMHDSLASTLGDIVIAQTFDIDQHPLGDYRVVIGRQPYVKGGGLDLFDVNTAVLNKEAISSYCERQAEAQVQLLDLAEATFTSSDNTGLVPDLNGKDNFRLFGNDENLLLIDVDPISGDEYPGVHDLILRQAEVLAAFVTAA